MTYVLRQSWKTDNLSFYAELQVGKKKSVACVWGESPVHDMLPGLMQTYHFSDSSIQLSIGQQQQQSQPNYTSWITAEQEIDMQHE